VKQRMSLAVPTRGHHMVKTGRQRYVPEVCKGLYGYSYAS
jgi:hypothetical protein